MDKQQPRARAIAPDRRSEEARHLLNVRNDSAGWTHRMVTCIAADLSVDWTSDGLLDLYRHSGRPAPRTMDDVVADIAERGPLGRRLLLEDHQAFLAISTGRSQAERLAWITMGTRLAFHASSSADPIRDERGSVIGALWYLEGLDETGGIPFASLLARPSISLYPEGVRRCVEAHRERERDALLEKAEGDRLLRRQAVRESMKTVR